MRGTFNETINISIIFLDCNGYSSLCDWWERRHEEINNKNATAILTEL